MLVGARQMGETEMWNKERKPMKILVFSDLHLHNWPYGSTLVDGMNSRLLDGYKVMKQIAHYINDNPVDACVFGGDLFHTHGKIDSAVLKVAYNGLNMISQHLKQPHDMYVIVGNHDTSDKSMRVHNLHWVEALGVNVMDKPCHNTFNGLPEELSFLPYTEDKQVMERFFQAAAEKGGTTCFMHQGIAEVPMGSGFLINELFTLDMIPEGVKHVYTGHYHTHNKVSDKATVIGSTMQLNWSDEGDTKGFLIVDTETGEIKQIESDAPKFITVDMNDGSCGFARGMQVENNFIRVKNYDEKDKEEIREMFSGSTRSVEFVQEQVDAIRLGVPSTPDGFNLPALVADYEKDQEVSDERSAVGKEIMG